MTVEEAIQQILHADYGEDVRNALANALDIINTNSQTYIFEQTTALDTWVIQHNLDRYPSVSIVDSAGTQVCGEITYENSNKIVITFTEAFTGTAYLN